MKVHRDGLINVDVQFSSLKKLQLECSKEYEDRIVSALGGDKIVTDSNILSAGVPLAQFFQSHFLISVKSGVI